MKNIIVTGSEGFIGKRLVEELEKDKNNNVFKIDRKAESDFEHTFGTDANLVVGIIERNNIDVVYHLAAQTSVFNENIDSITHDNIEVFIDIAIACNKHNVKLVYASSSTANVVNTTSYYGISKRFDEDFAKIYCPSATGVRLHNVFGETPRPKTLFWRLLNEETTVLYNNGSNVRCFTYIDDAVKGLILAQQSSEKLLNCVNMEPITILSFAEMVKDKFGDKVNYRIIDEVRRFDNNFQIIDEDYPIIDINYTSVKDALDKIGDKIDNKHGTKRC